MHGKLYLIPTTLGDSDLQWVIPEQVLQSLNSIHHFIVENVRTARRFLIKAKITNKIDDLHFYEMNKHTKPEEFDSIIKPLTDGINMGLLSEAGVPCVADPGSEIVKIAHQKNIQVVPFIGPSSIILALMASGMNGQNFTFLGYLPIKSHLRIKQIRFIEKRSMQENQTQIFIEAPYRNQQLLKDLLATCKENSRLCIATDITLSSEFIKTKPIKDWKKNIPDINKRPTIFLIQA